MSNNPNLNPLNNYLQILILKHSLVSEIALAKYCILSKNKAVSPDLNEN